MKRGTPRHPKVYDLVQALGLPVRSRVIVIGYLELLWHFTSEFAPQGDIGKYSDSRIEGAMDWNGTRGKLVEALTNTGWCDKSSEHRLLVHDWHDHADDSVKKRLTRAGLEFLTLTPEVTGQSPQPSQTTADNGSLPKPLPKPLPEPHAQPPTRRAPVPISRVRFDEWIKPFPRKPSEERAIHAWAFCYTAEDDAAIFACRDRYLASEEVSRGVCMNPEKFLNEQKVNNWNGQWPPARASPASPKDKGFVASVTRVMAERIARGEDPL